MAILNSIISVCYYLISAFVVFVLVKSIIKTKNIQDAILYSVMLMPFILRILRIK